MANRCCPERAPVRSARAPTAPPAARGYLWPGGASYGMPWPVSWQGMSMPVIALQCGGNLCSVSAAKHSGAAAPRPNEFLGRPGLPCAFARYWQLCATCARRVRPVQRDVVGSGPDRLAAVVPRRPCGRSCAGGVKQGVLYDAVVRRRARSACAAAAVPGLRCAARIAAFSGLNQPRGTTI